MSRLILPPGDQFRKIKRTVFYDRGVGSNGTSIDGRAPDIGSSTWQLRSGSIITDGTYLAPASPANIWIATYDTGYGEGLFQGIIRQPDQNATGAPLVRYGDGKFYSFIITNAFHGVALIEHNGTSIVQRANGAFTWPVYDVPFIFTYSGPTIALYLGGQLVASYNGATVNMTSGVVGLFYWIGLPKARNLQVVV